jgi:hypothetical protein
MYTIVNVRTHREDNRDRKKEGRKEESRRKERTREE